MPDLRDQLQQLLQGRVCIMGLGNVDHGDDGFGVRLAEELKGEGARPASNIQHPTSKGLRLGTPWMLDVGCWMLDVETLIIIAGTTPDRWIGQMAEADFDHLVFLDAVEFGGNPGSTVLLDAGEMVARFPQVSTHKISLGLLAKQVEASGRTKAWLLGVQPASLKTGEGLSPAVQATLDLLYELLNRLGRTSNIQHRTSNIQEMPKRSWLDVGCSPGSLAV
jgi:hydrogenase maturation protease